MAGFTRIQGSQNRFDLLAQARRKARTSEHRARSRLVTGLIERPSWIGDSQRYFKPLLTD